MIDIEEAVMEAVPVQRGVAVEVQELRKEFRRKDSRKRRERRGEKLQGVALDGVSFAMEKGETVAILGQNGSGKSTLVRLLSTLLLPDGGWARILGHDSSDGRAGGAPARQPCLRRGLVLQEDVLLGEPRLRSSVLRHDLEGDAGQDPRDPRARRVPAGPADEAMEALSRGMQQKVALARALLTSPVVLLLDEPTTGLDPRSKLEVQEFIREIRDDPRLDDPALHPRPRRGRGASPSGWGSSTAENCWRSSRPTTSSAGTGRTTLEEAFFAATGQEFEAEADDDDDREVFA